VFTDLYGSGCEFYEKYPRFCGAYDDEDFAAKEMCCVCDPVYGSELAREANFDAVDVDPFTELQRKWLIENESTGELRDGPIDYSALDNLNEEGWKDLINDQILGDSMTAQDPTLNWNQLSSSLDTFVGLREKAKGINLVCKNYDVDAETGEQAAYDSLGNGCKLYADFPATCGALDTDEFNSKQLCCACGGGSTAG